MSAILDLMEKRAKAWDAAKAFLASKGGGALTAEDSAAYNRMEAEVIALGKDVDRLTRQAAIDAELSAPTSAPILNTPHTGERNQANFLARKEYRADFIAAMRGRPTVHNVLQEGVDTDGGYLVPTEFERQIVAGLDDMNIMRTLAKVIKTSSDRNIPMADTTSTASWVGENGTIPDSGVTFGQKTLGAYKLTDKIKVSVELLADSMFDIESYLAADFARAFGAAEEAAFLTGTGTGQPTGLFAAVGGGSIGVTTAGAAITFDDVLNLVYSLKSAYRRKAAFIMNDATVGSIRKLKDGNGQYLWQPALAQGQPDRLFGYPLYTSPYAPTVLAGGFAAAFGDYSNYWIAERSARTLQRLNELYAETGQVGFLATQRIDGKVILAEGIKLLKMAA
jgi:HK97 family phage major capsid protein